MMVLILLSLQSFISRSSSLCSSSGSRGLHVTAVCCKVNCPGWMDILLSSCRKSTRIFKILLTTKVQFTGIPSFFLSHCLCLVQNRAARVRVGKGDKPVTYEQALAPHHIGHRKGWLSQHTSELQPSRFRLKA